MQTTNAEPCRPRLGRALAPAMALFLLLILAVPADAQRGRGGHSGRGGSGHHGQSYGGHSGHRGGGYSHGAHRGGGRHGSYGHRGHGRYSGRGYSGYRGYSGHRGYSHHRGHSGYRGHTGYGRHSSYRGYYRYPSYYGYPGYYRDDSYVYYRSPGSWGFGYQGYPGVSLYYDASPRTVVYGSGSQAPGSRYEEYLTAPEATSQGRGSRYDAYLAAPEAGISESGEPSRQAGGAFDARPDPARVTIQVEPGDASVYLDGRFLGLASELPQELWIDPGAHRLEVARPGFAGRSLDLDLESGEELEIDGRLEAEAQVPDLHR